MVTGYGVRSNRWRFRGSGSLVARIEIIPEWAMAFVRSPKDMMEVMEVMVMEGVEVVEVVEVSELLRGASRWSIFNVLASWWCLGMQRCRGKGGKILHPPHVPPLES